MLIDDVERYVAIRRALGFQLRKPSRQLRDYARLAEEHGESRVRVCRALAWAAMAPSPSSRHDRMRNVSNLARFLHAENPEHELLPPSPFRVTRSRPLPYIYAPNEIARMIAAARRLRRSYPLRREVWATLIGLIASTGLRTSEALDLTLSDVRPDGVLSVRNSKFGKSRLVPLHSTARTALDRYLEMRRRVAVTEARVFLSASDGRIASSMVSWTFRRIRTLARIAPERSRAPRLMDLRHTFATRALEKCQGDRRAISRHFVALSTYLGHVDTRATYWYLEATPELLTDISSAAESLMWEGRR
ncbi:MAG: tyrosine-type recombinase/integrase [bacterium]|nr:tyrosine-type recombinase/integrase [bacterium]